MKFLDDKSKKLTWWTRNYFYLGTILFVTTCILIYAFCGSSTPYIAGGTQGNFDLRNIIQGCLNSLFHSGWMHCLLNMLCFSVCGLYVERKTGTFNFVLLIMALYVIESAFTVATFMSLAYIGASGVQYFLYGYILVDYIFSFRKEKRNKTNIILGAIVLGLIYLAMCYSGGLSTIEFVLYPRDLITNDGHYAPFVAGIIVGLVIAVAQIKSALGMVQPADVEIGERKKNAYKKVYIIMLACVVALSSMNIICYGVAKSRKTVDVNITCNYEEFNQKSVLSGMHGEKGLSNIFSDWSTNCFNLEGNYVAELYEVRNKEKERAKFNTVIEDFVPLNLPTKREYYFEVFPAYTIEVSGLVRGSGLVNVSGYYPIPYYFLGFGLIYKAKANADFSFKINNNYGYSVLLNGKLIKKDKDGVYTIENVTSDLEIVIK